MIFQLVSFDVRKTCELPGDKDLPELRGNLGCWHSKGETATRNCAVCSQPAREHKNKLDSGNSKSHSETSVTILVHSPAALMWLNRLANLSAIVLFSFSLPPSRCSA